MGSADGEHKGGERGRVTPHWRRGPAFGLGYLWGWLRAGWWQGFHAGYTGRIQHDHPGAVMFVAQMTDISAARPPDTANTDPNAFRPARPEDIN